jgi:hypothetical protein
MDNPEKTEEAITNGQSRRGNHEWTIKKGQSRMDNQDGAITNGQSDNHEWTIQRHLQQRQQNKIQHNIEI